MLNVEPGETDPLHSVLIGELEEVTGCDVQLTLQTYDASGNKRHKGEDEILAEMIPLFGEESEENLTCNAVYDSEGLYSITCPAAAHAGNYLLQIDIITSSGEAKPIKDGPFRLTVFPGNATPGKTEVTSGGTQVAGGYTVMFTGTAGMYESFVVRGIYHCVALFDKEVALSISCLLIPF